MGKDFDKKDLGAAKKVLGMKKHINKSARKLWLSPKRYVENMLHVFDMINLKFVSTPRTNHFKMMLDPCPKTNAKDEHMLNILYVNCCLVYAIVFIISHLE